MSDEVGDPVEDAVRQVNRELVRAEDREALETAVVDVLTGSDHYRFAWIGRYDADVGVVTAVAHAGVEEGYLEDFAITDDPDDPRGRGPGGQALRSGDVVVDDDLAESPEFGPWREAALERAYRSVAVVPLVAGDDVFGLLAVYANRPGAFDAPERQQLAEIGANVGHAVAARDREQELERYRMLVDTVGDPMYVLDAEGTVEMANEAMAATLSLPVEEVVGSHVSRFVLDDDDHEWGELLAELAGSDRRWTSFELDVVTADGERIRAEDRVAALTDDQGRLVGSVGVIRDVTDRASERDRLRTLTDRIERLHGVATRLQAATNAEEIYELTVAAGEDILEFDWCVVAVAREGWLELAAVSDPSPVEVGDRHLRVDEGLAGAALREGESKITGDGRDDGVSEPVHESFVASVVVPLGEMGVFQANASERGYFDDQDIELGELLAAHATEALSRVDREQVLRDRERELQRQNERLEQFASVLSHDLRNPLNLADGRLELARDALAAEPDDVAAVDEHLAQADWAIDRMARLVENVLTLAREGRTPEETEPLDLADVVADAWATTVDDGAELVVPSDPGTVVADRNRLLRILENLFRNAMEHAGPDPRVVAGPSRGGFYVADDGPGIPEEDRDRVFESGYTTANDGTGFGLAIVRELAAAHGWSVDVIESEAGGARFEFSGVEVRDGE